jgi:hypothetical protein
MTKYVLWNSADLPPATDTSIVERSALAAAAMATADTNSNTNRMSISSYLRHCNIIVSISTLFIAIRPASSLINLSRQHSLRFGSSLNSIMPERSLNIHWFRQTDQRLHDNPALCRTVELASGKSTKRVVGAAPPADSSKAAGIVPVYIFDSRLFGSSVQFKSGEELKHNTSVKCSARRAKFLIESIQDLRESLEKRGSGLVVSLGEPETVLASIAINASKSGAGLVMNVVCQEEVCSEELAVDKAVKSSLAKAMKSGNKFSFETVWGSTMYDPNTLPFDQGVYGIPDTFTPFRNKGETIGSTCLLFYGFDYALILNLTCTSSFSFNFINISLYHNSS